MLPTLKGSWGLCYNSFLKSSVLYAIYTAHHISAHLFIIAFPVSTRDWERETLRASSPSKVMIPAPECGEGKETAGRICIWDREVCTLGELCLESVYKLCSISPLRSLPPLIYAASDPPTLDRSRTGIPCRCRREGGTDLLRSGFASAAGGRVTGQFMGRGGRR